MSTAVHPEEVTSEVQLLIDQRRFPAAGLTVAATVFLATSLNNLQTFLTSVSSNEISRLNWGLAGDIESNIRYLVFSGSLSTHRGEVVNQLLQETLVKLPYYRDDDNRKVNGAVPLFSIYNLWKHYGGLIDWLGYRSGIPLTISGWYNNGVSFPSSLTRNFSTTITASEDTCGGILKLLALAYPVGHSILRISVFSVILDFNDLNAHAGARGIEYHIIFNDGSEVGCNSGEFMQGFISAAGWIAMDSSVYISSIKNRAGQLCEVII